MGIVAWSGPIVGYGITTTSSGAVTEYNEERGPALFDLGQGLMDSRPNYNYDPGNAVGSRIFSLWDNAAVGDVTFTASAQGAPGTIISCLTGSSQLTALTLNTTVTSSINGVATNVTILAPETGQNVVMPLAVDVGALSSTPNLQGLTFGSGGTAAIWNPANLIGRNVVIWGTAASSQDDSSVSVSVAGRDVYGFKMTETIKMSSLSITSRVLVQSSLGTGFGIGQKAFKYISAVSMTNSSLINSTNINVSFGSLYGFPARIDSPAYCSATWLTSGSTSSVTFNNSSLGFTFASTYATPSASSPDVRGTWASSTLIGAGQRLTLYSNINPSALNVVTNTNVVSIWGTSQYSSV